MLVKEYSTEKDTIIEALDDIDSFIYRMELFRENHPSYSYKIDIKRTTSKRNDKKWIVVLKVNKDEPENVKTT
jgi:hypothetical protein